MKSFIKKAALITSLAVVTGFGLGAYAFASQEGDTNKQSRMCVAEAGGPAFLTCDDLKLLTGK